MLVRFWGISVGVCVVFTRLYASLLVLCTLTYSRFSNECCITEYGSEWIPEIPGAVVTFDENMNAADEFLEQYKEWYDTMRDKLPEDVAEGLWHLATHFPTQSEVMGNLPRAEWNQVLQALQQQQDSDNNDESSIVRQFLRKEGVRDLEWLKKHGRCQDHIRPDISTIPQAGRGAFATRFLPKGTIVGYSPLIHMGNNRKLWEIKYKGEKEKGKRKNIKYTNQDLILNYSFGHRDSTLVLTPYGAMVNFINHAPKDKANIKIQWPEQESEAHKPEWLNKDLDFLIHTIDKIGLSFEYVALRDIEEGEEVFLDYGDEWQVAWDEHVKNWKPPPGAENYTHSTEWKGPLLTPSEQAETPYPPNLVTVCIESYSYVKETDQHRWTPVVRNTTHRVFCDVVDRKDGDSGEEDDYVYDVRFKYENGEEFDVLNVPKEGIQLKDKLYSADWHLENAFRHEIMIPDDMFPESWKNKKEEVSNEKAATDDKDKRQDEL